MEQDASQVENAGLTRAVSSLTKGILVALCLIAVIAGTAHLVTDLVIETQATSARVINVSGRQRMLSQRIALMAERYENSEDEDEWQRFREAVDRFERSHLGLINGDAELGLPSELPQRAREIYFAAPYDLDRRSREFIAHSKAVLTDRSSGDRARLSRLALPLRDDAMSFLASQDAAVRAFESHQRDQISWLHRIQSMAVVVLGVALALGGLLVLRPMLRRVNSMADNLDQMTVTDPLTGVLNRRGFLQQAEQRLTEHQEGAVLILDIDHFKQINDRYGHGAGDACIQHVCTVATDLFRSSDVFGRIGGEEFAAMVTGVGLSTALKIGDRLRAAIEQAPCDVSKLTRRTDTISMTVSVGVAPHDGVFELDRLLQHADSALYHAKRHGRNCVLPFEGTVSLPVFKVDAKIASSKDKGTGTAG